MKTGRENAGVKMQTKGRNFWKIYCKEKWSNEGGKCCGRMKGFSWKKWVQQKIRLKMQKHDINILNGGGGQDGTINSPNGSSRENWSKFHEFWAPKQAAWFTKTVCSEQIQWICHDFLCSKNMKNVMAAGRLRFNQVVRFVARGPMASKCENSDKEDDKAPSWIMTCRPNQNLHLGTKSDTKRNCM